MAQERWRTILSSLVSWPRIKMALAHNTGFARENQMRLKIRALLSKSKETKMLLLYLSFNARDKGLVWYFCEDNQLWKNSR